MVQIISPSPRAMQGAEIGKAAGQGIAKRLGLMEAEQSFKEAQGDPYKLATAFARLSSVSPELARGTGPMYQAMLNQMQTEAIRRGVGQGGPQQMSGGISREGAMPTIDEALNQNNMPINEPVQGIQDTNIVSERMLPKAYWSPEQRLSRIKYYTDLGFLTDQARSEAEKDERAYMANPEQYQKRFELLQQKRKDAQSELRRQLEIKTQKKGEELYKDIPGEYLVGMEKGLERDIRENPNLTVEQIADRWSTRALDTAKAKNQFMKLADTQGIENLLKGKATKEKLDTYSKIFERSGNQEEYYNLLRSRLKTSPQASASIAFKTRPELKEILDKNVVYKSPSLYTNKAKEAQDFAKKLEGKILPNDSLLGIAWDAKRKDRSFDERAFFEQVNKSFEDLTPRQQREIAEGTERLKPYWADILIFPWLGE